MSNEKQKNIRSSVLSVKQIERAFHEWLLGSSLRKLAKKYSIGKSTFSIYFKRHYGNNYSKIPRLRGVIHIIKEEYLKDRSYSVRQQKEIKDFLDHNFDRLFEIDFANLGVVNNLYTNKELLQLTLAETSNGLYDYRMLFDTYYYEDVKIG